MMSRRRWLAGWGLMAGTYLALGIPRAVTGDLDSTMVYLAMAVATLAIALATLPIMAPRRRGGAPPGPRGKGDPAPDEPPPPPWWPEFEREFWGSLRSSRSEPAERSETLAGAGD